MSWWEDQLLNNISKILQKLCDYCNTETVTNQAHTQQSEDAASYLTNTYKSRPIGYSELQHIYALFYIP